MRHEACGREHNAQRTTHDASGRRLGVVFLNGVVGLSLQTQPPGITFSDYTQPQSTTHDASGSYALTLILALYLA